jgi:eukaryotic-like serine/threonine-protein kinase
MGVIFRAQDRLTERQVAYKRLHVPDESARARLTALFQREYDTLTRLPHPNIVEVYDYGEDADGPYYAMELLTGRDLTAVAPLPYREACRVVRDVASALALLHARRLIHRDVSPGNVRLTADGRAKLLDFGGLMPFGRPKELVGTPICMAPEVLAQVELDQRSDLYSLGTVAYWALTRRTSINARTLEDLHAAWEEPTVPPSDYIKGIPGELDALVLSLLARDPLARPASAAYVIDRLTSIAELAPETDERRVAYSYLAHPPLIGRSDVLAICEHALDDASEQRGRAVLIEGSAGLGRSALLDSVALTAQLAGATVLRGHGNRDTGPFAVARELSRTALALYPELA